MLAKVLLDANVLYSRTLRDWALLLSLEGVMYRGYWTEDIAAETVYWLRRNHPDWDGAVFSRFREKLERCLEKITDYEARSDYPGSDPDDAHLHSAAVAAGVGYVVTGDHGLAATGDVDLLPYEIYLPDDFFVLVDESSPETVRAVTKLQADHLFAKYGQSNLVESLEVAGCPSFAERVRAHLLALY